MDNKKDDQSKFENELVSKLNYYTVLCSNSYGVMYEFDEPNFIESLQMIDKSKPVADLGVAYGYSTKRLLNDGFYVFANDLSKDMLNTLAYSVPKEQLSHLKLLPGNVLDISFPHNSLGAIFALRFMHFLKGDDFRKLFKNYYDWLSPGGILVVSCATSLYHFISCFQNEYKTNLQLDLEWPGELELAGKLLNFKN
jgi:SAM-dependent methyltransferase